ncbi:MAG: metalloregulator ArsR/SmtB family transcription factor [Kofleriaceae bacterium]
MSDLDAAFGALSDATRRKALLLLTRRELRAGELAQHLGLAAPAMSKHLKVLRDSKLVEIDADASDARAKVYRLRRAGFREVSGWLEGVERFWSDQLEGFTAYAERKR